MQGMVDFYRVNINYSL